jgi:cobalt/nickel transport system permease protein
VTSSHGAGPAPDRLRSPLTGLAPEAKVLGLVAFLAVVGLTPPRAPAALAAQGAVAAAVALVALVEWRAVVGRLALDLPLAVLALAYAVAGRGPHVEVLGLALSRPGLEAGLGIMAKATIGIVAVSALAASTSLPETNAGLARVGAPAWFRQLLALSARQLQVLRSDLVRIRRAVAVRTASRRRAAPLAAGTRALGSLFVRSVERADTLRLAAELRGGDAMTPLAPVAARAPRPDPGPAGRRGATWGVALAPAVVAAILAVVLR